MFEFGVLLITPMLVLVETGWNLECKSEIGDWFANLFPSGYHFLFVWYSWVLAVSGLNQRTH